MNNNLYRVVNNPSSCIFTSNGVGRSGAFCAIASTLERVKQEQVLDVFQTVKSIRTNRPGAVQTLVCITRSGLPVVKWTGGPKSHPLSSLLSKGSSIKIVERRVGSLLILLFSCFQQTQYVFCYQIVQKYLDSFSDYANFNG